MDRLVQEIAELYRLRKYSVAPNTCAPQPKALVVIGKAGNPVDYPAARRPQKLTTAKLLHEP